MKINLYQVFYENGQQIDKNCIPYSAVGVNVSPLYENKHILDIYKSINLKGVDYWGVTSHRLHEKTGLTYKDISTYIHANPGSDVYLYSDYGNESSLSANSKNAIGIAWDRLFELGIFSSKLDNKSWINVFCNFWIAKPEVVERYIIYLTKTIKYLEKDPILKDITDNSVFPYRGKLMPVTPFILEYLFGLFLKDNPDITYTRIPNKTSLTPYMSNPSSIKYSKIKVSIIVTARNYGKYLKEALQSCLSQTVPCEVIYSDDFSDDNSVKIAKSLGVKVVTHKEHVGVVVARNNGFDASSGDAIVFMDGDDILPDNFIEKHLEVFDENTPYVYCAAQAFGAFSTFWDVHPWGVLDLWNRNFVNTNAMRWRHTFETAGKWQETSEKTMWDFHLALREARLGTPRKSDAVLLYRQHNDSVSFGKEKTEGRMTEISIKVRKNVVKLSIGVVYSGRLPGLFDLWIESLISDMEVLNHLPELIIYNNSDIDLNQKLKKYSHHFSKIKIIEHPEKIKFSSEVERRNKVCEFLANAYNMIVENCTGDLIHLREDDVVTPEGGFSKMFDLVIGRERINDAVAGAYFNRRKDYPRWIGGRFNTEDIRKTSDFRELPKSSDPIPVDFTGTGCLLYWKHRCPKLFKPYLHGIQAHDWAWGHEHKMNGGTLLLLPDVICKHYQTETEFIQPINRNLIEKFSGFL